MADGVDPEVEAALVGGAVEGRCVEADHLRRRVGGVEHQPAVGEADFLDVRKAVGVAARGEVHAPVGVPLRDRAAVAVRREIHPIVSAAPVDRRVGVAGDEAVVAGGAGDAAGGGRRRGRNGGSGQEVRRSEEAVVELEGLDAGHRVGAIAGAALVGDDEAGRRRLDGEVGAQAVVGRGVGADAAVDGVVAAAAVEEVVATLAIEGVVAVESDQDVAEPAAEHRVAEGGAEDAVDVVQLVQAAGVAEAVEGGVAEELDPHRTRRSPVGGEGESVAAEEGVAAGVADEDVAAGAAREHLRPVRPVLNGHVRRFPKTCPGLPTDRRSIRFHN